MSVLNMLSGRLNPTATYAVREWRWVPNDPEANPEGPLGELTIILQKAERNGRTRPTKVESDTYAVAEEPGFDAVGRHFLLMNLTDPAQPEVYGVQIGPRGCDCNCKQGQVDRGRRAVNDDEVGCKHRDAMKAVLEALKEVGL
jgi:hypothetical protein